MSRGSAMEDESTRVPLPRDDPGVPQGALAKDRRCSECGVRLSLYNPGPNCWQHTIGWPWRGPSAKPRY
jgi:hypothetical protein